MSTVLPRYGRLLVLMGAMLASVVLLAACVAGAAPAGAPSTSAGPATVTLTPDPNPMLANQEATLKIRLADATGNGVSGAKVNVSAAHTEMAHGSVDANATDNGNGEYVAKLKPSMAGTWNVTVTAEAGATKKANFDVQVK